MIGTYAGAQMTSAKRAALIARVQLNPEILTDDATFIGELVDRAANDLCAHCYLPRYPELSQGFAKSRVGVSTDITALASSSIMFSANGMDTVEVTLTLAGLDTGAEIAAALQTAIRASEVDSYEEITVTFAGSGATAQYTVTSGMYGESSTVHFGFDSTERHLASALGLTEMYGAIEVQGSAAKPQADDVVVELAEIAYRKVGVEAAGSGSVPGDITFSMLEGELSGQARRTLNSMRRLYR